MGSRFFLCGQVFWTCVLISIGSNAWAVKNYFEISDSEMKMLPKFCKTGIKGVPRQERIWMNHLCPGLNALNHAKLNFSNKRSKKYALEDAERHFTYTLDHVKNKKYRSFTFLKRGEVYSANGDRVAALADYNQALTLAPKNIAVHLALIDTYIKLGDIDTARRIVNQGLKIKPNSKSLLRRKKKVN